MPAKNAEKHLKDCLNSIINQSFKNWELIVVNDNSTDETEAILKFYSQEETRISYFNNSDSGIISALQLAYSKCSGNYITRMDADDIMPFDKLELMQNAILKNPNALITGLVKYIADDKLFDGYLAYETWLNNLVFNQNHFAEIYKECVIPSPCWLVSRTTFELCGAFNSEIYPEDYDLSFRFYKNKIKVIVVPEVLHIWRDHSTRASRNDSNYSDNAFLDIKVFYFLKLDFDKNKILVLWGAGGKAKKIAQILSEQKIDFVWACNNSKKIGHNIYGQILQDIETVFESEKNYQTIMTVANKTEQKELKTNLINQTNIEDFWFC